MIPNIFHFVFGLRQQDEPFHLLFYLCLESCRQINKPSAIYFHYQHEPWGPWWDLIRPHLVLMPVQPESFVSEYEYKRDPKLARYRYAHMADFVRLQVLLQHGGIYADMDSLFLRPLPSEWLASKCIMGHEKAPPAAGDSGSLCNAWIAAEPGAEFCSLWLEQMQAAFDGSWSNHSTLLPYRLARQYPELINVQPEAAFFALDWTPKGVNDLFLRAVKLPRESYSLHLWNHLWADAAQLNFSHFHQALLTPDYVRHANATYAKHARAFLPDAVKTSYLRYLLQTAGNNLHHPLYALITSLGMR